VKALRSKLNANNVITAEMIKESRILRQLFFEWHP